jgi:lipopolysaccharide biosynthesis protein
MVRELAGSMAVAFYLPQYHPIPENDEWWGPGFTEWANVARGRPQFRGHYQPRLPADLGFYDLRVPEVRDRQAALAADAGLGGFAYYHYWFNGRRLLERPVDEVLGTQRPDFPFMLVWANENWTRAWDGGERSILLAQSYSLADDLAHIRALRPALCDERYLCHDGKPVFAVYRSKRLPDPVATTDIWRREAELWGLPGLYLLRVESAADEFGDPRPLGFDAAVEFQPAWSRLGNPLWSFDVLRPLRKLSPRYSHHVYAYEDVAERAMSATIPDYPRWPGVAPGFDNSARCKRNAYIFVRQSPQVYQNWLSQALRRSQDVAQRYEGSGRGVVFINAWNEWAEGNYLEPDDRFGHAFLDATKAAIDLVSVL